MLWPMASGGGSLVSGIEVFGSADFTLYFAWKVVDARVATHVEGVHAADAVVAVAAETAGAFALLDFVDKVGVADEGTGHLESNET